MLFVMLLAGVEKLVNFAIQSDKITQLGLEALAGKSMRLVMTTPALQIDTLFNSDGIRFEPVKDKNLFESQNPLESSTPSCSIIVDTPLELLNLIRSPEGNLPIEGDYKVLMQVRELVAGFHPDIVTQLEPFIGVSLASQLAQVIQQLQVSVGNSAKHKFHETSEWANDITGCHKPTSEELSEFNSLNQQLLKLRADIDREQARLDAIKSEQAKLQSESRIN